MLADSFALLLTLTRASTGPSSPSLESSGSGSDEAGPGLTRFPTPVGVICGVVVETRDDDRAIDVDGKVVVRGESGEVGVEEGREEAEVETAATDEAEVDPSTGKVVATREADVDDCWPDVVFVSFSPSDSESELEPPLSSSELGDRKSSTVLFKSPRD
jgi:hypothetical protein